jgi:NAD(P)-dependent dehydrogenase (short-subunit alcohol dehydrogenase family)
MTVSQKVALVTGCSSGIGLSTAILLAQHGFIVIATMRDTKKAEALERQAREANVDIDVRTLDVREPSSIEHCVQGVLHTFGRIDLLVNNAGVGYHGAMEQTSLHDLRRLMEVNFFGTWSVTQAVFPLMRAARSGHIITVTSVAGLIGQPFRDAYCATKFAIEGFMESLAPVAQQFGIKVTLIEPGPVKTNFATSEICSPGLQEIYGPLQERQFEQRRRAEPQKSQKRRVALELAPKQVGQLILDAATAEAPHFRYTTSAVMEGLILQKYVDVHGDALVTFLATRLGKAR